MSCLHDVVTHEAEVICVERVGSTLVTTDLFEYFKGAYFNLVTDYQQTTVITDRGL